MSSRPTETVEDRKGLLSADDHMRDMDRLEMEVVSLTRPFASVARVTGRIAPHDAAAWAVPNVAVRLEVECPEGERPVSRIYTVRSFDAGRNLIEIDFVLHEDDSPAMRWLRTAGPGTRVGMIGPRQHFVPDHATGLPAAIFADETAIPAVYAILQAWPEGAEGALWIETRDRAAVDELPLPEGVACHLLLRRAGEAHGTDRRLLAAAQSLPEPAGWTVWAAGERQEMRALRSHFQAAGLPRERLRVFGYWRQGVTSSEIDRVRLSAYEAMRAQGLTLDALSDADLPV